MEDDQAIKEAIDGHDERGTREEIFTKIVRAGKRTYFFDVKTTRQDDYYLTITESKKRLGKEGKVFYEKHKIFLYKEDFEKFADGLRDAVEYIGDESNVTEVAKQSENAAVSFDKNILAAVEYTSIEFDDLGEK
ncbi:MAG: DUF3276 family protein [Bacteroidetes bacterium]|nr:DUF3276 family protein [Bacteroidota bacterium]